MIDAMAARYQMAPAMPLGAPSRSLWATDYRFTVTAGEVTTVEPVVLVAVTVTVTDCPKLPATGVYVDDTAPAMGLPSAFHW